MRKRLFGLLLLVCLIVTSIPSAFFAAETQTKTVKVVAYAEDAETDTTPLDGVKLTLALCNEETGTGTLLTESLETGANSCSLTYNSDGKFVFEGQEYTYFRVTVYAKVDGYVTITNALHNYTVEEFDAIRDEKGVVTLKYMVEKEPVVEDVVRLATEDCYVGARYEDGVYQWTEVIYMAGDAYSDEKMLEALEVLTEDDIYTSVFVTFDGETFPTVGAEVLAQLKEQEADFMLENESTAEAMYWEKVDTDTMPTIKEEKDASLAAALDTAEITYIMFQAQNVTGSENFMAYLKFTPDVLAKGEEVYGNGETYFHYEDSKYVYYYDSEKECFTLTTESLFFEKHEDLEWPEENYEAVSFEGTQLPSSGYYVIVDEALPDSLTTPKEETPDATPEIPDETTPDPEENVSISQPVGDSKVVIELEAEAGVVPADTQLSVSKIESGESHTKAENALEGVVTETTEVYLYDITLLDSENAKVQPDGKVTITIALEEDLDADAKVTVYRIEEDGTKTLIEGAKVVDGKVVFTTDHFSTYAVLIGDVVTVPDTGDSSAVGFYMMILVVGAALLFVNKKQFAK